MPLIRLEKSESVNQVFSKLKEWDVITEEHIRVVKGFACAMYRSKRSDKVQTELWFFS